MKRTMTLNLTDKEMQIIEGLCESKGLSKTALVKQALRLYQKIESRLEAGDKVFLEDCKTKEKAEVLML